MSEWGRSWWVVVFCLGLGFVYIHSIKEKKNAVQELSLRLQQTEEAKCFALKTREDLRLRIASQNDPSWIEMILMRDLGMVPEGFLKVHFKK